MKYPLIEQTENTGYQCFENPNYESHIHRNAQRNIWCYFHIAGQRKRQLSGRSVHSRNTWQKGG